MKKIMLFSKDPGGANCISQLVEPLRKSGYEVLLFGKGTALKRYAYFGLQGDDFDKVIDNNTTESIVFFLSQTKPNFVITGTSGDDFTEKYLWKACEGLNIPCFAVLDAWNNYGIRFSQYSINEMNQFVNERDNKYLPTKVLVMDEFAKEKLSNEGINEERILISGQPYFDYLINKKLLLENDSEQEWKNQIGCCGEDIIIVFISQPLEAMYKGIDSAEGYWGYDEKTTVKKIVKTLDEIAQNVDINIKVVIKLHPREDIDNYEEIIPYIMSPKITINIDHEMDTFQLVMAADLVCGMWSMVLVEAALLRKPVMSIQIGLKRENPLVLEEMGVLTTIRSDQELEDDLKLFLLNKSYPLRSLDIKYGAIEKIIDYMEEILCQN